MKNIWLFLFFLAPRKSVRSRLVKGVLLRQTINEPEQVSDHSYFLSLRYLHRIIRILFRVGRQLKSDRESHASVAFTFGLPEPMVSAYLGEFASESDLQIVEAGAFSGLKWNAGRLGPSAILRSLRWTLWWMSATVASIFSRRKYDSGWCVDLFELGLKASLLAGSRRRYYFFLSLSPVSYLLCYYISTVLKCECHFISSNSAMCRPMRYTYLPDANLALCSRFQAEEYRIFSANGWMKFKSVSLWGLEEQKDLKPAQAAKKRFEYDIAIYSSAEWARNASFWREKDINKIRRHELLDGYPYRLFTEYVLEPVSSLKTELGLRVILYPHPFERQLATKAQIAAPYLQFLKENGIMYDDSGTNSVPSLYGSRIGVATCSTIVTDRWHLGLTGFVYSGGNDRRFKVDYDYKYLGEFRKYCYHSPGHLKELIKASLA